MRRSVLLLALLVILICQGCGGKTKEELYAQGVAKQKEQDPAAAVVLFKSALEKDQNYLDARYQQAKAFSAQGKAEQAEKEFLKIQKSDPSRKDVTLELARVYIKLQRTDETFVPG